MSVPTVATFLGILALVAFLGVLGSLAAWVASRLGALPTGLVAARDAVRPAATALAFVVAATATAGSLYFSEVAGFMPCSLCWYQRAAMYPLLVILGIAVLRRDRSVGRYAIPLAAIGALISAWHIGVERIPGLPSGSCSLDVPCSTIVVEVLGFVTIPTMALAGFTAVLTLMLVARGGQGERTAETRT